MDFRKNKANPSFTERLPQSLLGLVLYVLTGICSFLMFWRWCEKEQPPQVDYDSGSDEASFLLDNEEDTPGK